MNHAQKEPKASETRIAAGIPSDVKVRRILVCQLRQIGDVLLATPAIELLSKRYPNAEIHVFTEKKCVPMLENNPYVHCIRVLDKKELGGVLKQVKFYWQLGRDNFDILVNFQHLPRCTWVAAFSNANVKLASDHSWYAKYIYTHLSKFGPGYSSAQKSNLLRPFGLEWNGEKPRLYLTEKELADGQALLEVMGLGGKRFVSIDATHHDALRRWPADYYARLIDMIAEAEPDLHFMLGYGPGEEQYVRELAEMTQHKERLGILPTVQSLRMLAACISQAVMHLGNCSAPRHMAVALDVPTFGILEPRGRHWTFPAPEHSYVELNQIQPGSCEVFSLECMTGLTPELVFPRFMEHFHTHGKR